MFGCRYILKESLEKWRFRRDFHIFLVFKQKRLFVFRNFEIFKIFWDSQNFWSYFKLFWDSQEVFGKFEIFKKFWHFQEILRFSRSIYKISWKFPTLKISKYFLRISKYLKNSYFVQFFVWKLNFQSIYRNFDILKKFWNFTDFQEILRFLFYLFLIFFWIFFLVVDMLRSSVKCVERIFCVSSRSATFYGNDANRAVSDISDGSKLLVGGFGLCGIPENLINGLLTTGVKVSLTPSARFGPFSKYSIYKFTERLLNFSVKFGCFPIFLQNFSIDQNIENFFQSWIY